MKEMMKTETLNKRKIMVTKERAMEEKVEKTSK